jgi:hypothetical protein
MANVYGLIFEIDDKTKAGANSINRRLNSIADNAKRVKSAMRGVGSIAGTAVGALGKVAAGATAAAAAFGFLAKKNLDSLDALGKTAAKLGVSTKFLSEYSFVAEQAGLSTDQFQTGLQRFIRRLGQAQQGSGELLKPLEQLGINMRDSNGNFREGTEVFQEFLTKLNGTKNNAQKLALAMGAFDTEGVAFVNIASMGATEISRLRTEVEKAGASIDEKLTKAAAEANDKLNELLLRAKGFGLQFFGAMAPAISTLADDIKKALDEAVAGSGGMEAFAQNLAADFLTSSASLIRNLGIMFDGFRNTLNGAVNVVQRIIVAISKIPGSGFDAQIGDASGLNAQKSAAKEAMAEQQALFDAAQEKVQRLRQELADLPSGWLGKKDPNNVAGQLTQAVYEANSLGRELEQTKGELEALNSTFIFEELKTDYDGMTTSSANFAKKLEDEASGLRESAAAAAKRNEIARQYPYSEQDDAITRLAAREKVIQEAKKTTTVVTQEELDRQQALNAHHHKVYARTREEQRQKELAEQQKEYQDKIAAANRVYAETRVIGQRMHAQELSTIQKNQQAHALYYRTRQIQLEADAQKQAETIKRNQQANALYARTRQIQLEADAKKVLENEEKNKAAHMEYGRTRLQAAKEFAEKEIAVLEKIKQAYALYGRTRMIAHQDEIKKREEEQRRTQQAYAQYGFLRGRAPKDPVKPDKPTSLVSTEITTLSDLQKSMAADSAKSATNMRIFKEYLASGNYSAQELQAAMNKLGISMDDLPYGAFKEVFTATTEAGMASTNNLKKLQGELNKLVKDGIKLTEVQQTMLDNINEQLGTETFDVAQRLEDQFKGMIGTVSNTFTDVILGLKDGFTSLEDLALQSLRMIISTLIEAIIRATILKQTVNFGGGGFFGSLLGGLGSLGLGTLIPGLGLLAGVGMAIGSRASGGPVKDGKSYMVGERGPELFRPDQSGTIVSNEELNSVGDQGDLNVSFTINAIDTQTGVQFLLENKRVITGVIQEAYMRRGTSGPLG